MSLLSEAAPSATKPTARVHLDYLDSLRGFAALYVVVFHTLSYQWGHLSARTMATMTPLSYGHEAVDLFIVLSGFSLMLPVVRGGTLQVGAINFFKKRARRILPPYYAAMALSLLLDWTLLSPKTGTGYNCVPVNLSGFLTHLVLIQDVFSSTWAQINSPFWSISVEWRIYFCFPLLVLAWRRIGPFATTALTLLISCALALAFNLVPILKQFHSQNNGMSPQYLGLFALGMLGAGLAFSPNPTLSELRVRLPWGMLAWATAAVALVACRVWHDKNWISDYFVGTCAVLVIITGAVGDGRLRRVLSWRPLVRVGTFAYSLYLIHYPVLRLVWLYLVHPLHLGARTEFALHTLVGMPCALGAAYLFFLAFERPFLNTRSKETPAETARDAALSPAP